MAGQPNKWIKFEKELATGAPKVLRIASRLRNAGVTPESLYTLATLGALTRLWSFADTHIREDNTLSCSLTEINEVIGIANFCDLLPPEWLQVLDSDRVHLPDFLEHNGIKARTRALGAERQKRFRQAHNDNVTPESLKSNANVTPGALPKTIDHKTLKTPPVSPPSKRPTRIPADWQMTAEMADYARTMGIDDPNRTAEDFKDYWTTLAGGRALKLEWPLVWRKWCRKTLDMRADALPPRTNGHNTAPPAQRDAAAWAEARAAAREIGFRDPYPMQTPTSYMQDVKTARDTPPKFSLSQLQARAQR